MISHGHEVLRLRSSRRLWAPFGTSLSMTCSQIPLQLLQRLPHCPRHRSLRIIADRCGKSDLLHCLSDEESASVCFCANLMTVLCSFRNSFDIKLRDRVFLHCECHGDFLCEAFGVPVFLCVRIFSSTKQ